MRASNHRPNLNRDRAARSHPTPLLAELAHAFPGRTISIIQGYTDPKRSANAKSHAQGRALDLRIDNVDCTDIERFLMERPRLLARVGCFPNATFFHVDVGRSRGIWFDAAVGLD